MRNARHRFADSAQSTGSRWAPRCLLALAFAFVAILVLAPAAGAKLGVLGYFDLSQEKILPKVGSSAGNVGAGFAVRDSGAPSSDAGDLYVSGSRTEFANSQQSTTGGLVEQFSPTNAFTRLWGTNVVANGPDQANETQAVRIDAIAGTFKLSFGAATTTDLSATATAAQVQAALNALPSISSGGGSVGVSGGPGGASGANPYLVSFDGGPLGGQDQPQLSAADGATPLSGASASATVYTTSQGGVGSEVCEPAKGDACQSPVDVGFGDHAFSLDQDAALLGALGPSPTSLDVDQANGDLYALSSSLFLSRIVRFSAEGQPLSTIGFDVVRQGPDDSTVNDTQQLTVTAASGSYTLSFFVGHIGLQTTAPIPVGASAATVKATIDALPYLQNSGGSVSVSGPAGGPYTISFDGGNAGGDEWDQFRPSPSNAGTVTTLQDGGGPELCTLRDLCKQGIASESGNFTGAIGQGDGLAVAPPSAPNHGDLLIPGYLSVSELTPTGRLVRNFGGGVIDGGAAGTGDLTAGSPIVTSVATTARAFAIGQQISAAGGQIPAGTTIGSIGAGTLTLSKPATASGSGIALSAPTGSGNVANNEQQTVKIDPNTTGGTFELTFSTPNPSNSSQTTAAIPYNAPAAGPGSVQEALENLSNVDPGDLSVSGSGGAGGAYTIDYGGRFADTNVNRIASDGSGLIGTQTVTVVRAANSTFSLSFKSQTTAGLPFDASAATVQSALASLSTIGPGNVSVAGADGGPWTVSFTGALAGSPQPKMSANTGSFGSVSVAAPTAAVSTPTQGASAFEVCTAASGELCDPGVSGSGLGQFAFSSTGVPAVTSLSEGSSGDIYTVERGGDGNHRVQKFTDAGGLDLTPSVLGVNETQQLTVDAAAGQFRLAAVGLGAVSGSAAGVTGSATLTNVSVATGALEVGQQISGGYVPVAATITAVDSLNHTLTMSRPMGLSSGNITFTSNLTYTTPDLPYNATAAQVQAAIDALAPLAAQGASVTVSGGPSGPADPGPYTYTISYDGGSAPGTDFAPLRTAAGSTPLSGGAAEAGLSTLGDGGPSGRVGDNINADSPLAVAVEPGGEPLVAKQFPDLSAACPAGFPFADSFNVNRLQRFSADGLTLQDTSLPCPLDPAFFENGKLSLASGSALKIDQTSGDAYLGRYVYGEVGTEPQFSLDPVTDVGAGGATLSGTIDPNGVGPIDLPNPSLTEYKVEYRKVGDPDWSTYVDGLNAGSGPDPVPFSVGISGLLPKTQYEARVTVTKPFGFTPLVQTTAPFTTLAGKPKVGSAFADNVSASSADLHAQVTPSGADTTYHFEYGTTTAYGQNTPAVAVGDGTDAVSAQAHLDSLDPVVYHFRVVATNSQGTAVGPDQTFNFYPEPCPNDAARQQTGSSLLPDCRAYELIVPPNMGTITLFTQGPSAAYATNPSRFAYQGAFGTLPGPWNPPNVTSDTYVATRTDSGWDTHFVGLQANQFGLPLYNPDGLGLFLPGDAGLDRFLQWGPNTDYTGYSSAPYLFDADGNQLGRLPTDLAEIPGGDASVSDADGNIIDTGGFIGDQMLSPDGSHFFYSSVNVPLAPGGLTSGAGSVYDNDIATGTVSIVSKTAAGADIPAVSGTAGHFLRLAAASSGGSHLLIAAPANCIGNNSGIKPCPVSPAVLYMSVNDTTHYDVSAGHAVDFGGMSADGSKVLFTSSDQITPDDTDQSADLYMWSEATNTITRLSAGSGGGVGNVDGCNAAWISGCGVQIVPHENVDPTGGQGNLKSSTDNAVASQNGAVYFYSPEQFVGSEGFPGRRNLYVYRNGQVDYVATLDADRPAIRIQVSANGRYAAFITATRLTNFDNAGHAEMYRYDDDTGELACVSCAPDGTPPAYDVEGSQNGIFMTDDGRTFFATKDPLVSRDTDGLIDVYEYTEGRPQLITTGIVSQEGDPTSNSGRAGLVGVSANGTDVYFSTLESLVVQDHNGPFLKYYDARTNGGFPVNAQIQPCAAADECHGPGNPPPPPPNVHSGADLGAGGDLAPPKPCRKGTVRKHGRCVKKPAKHRRHHRKRAQAKHGSAK